MIRHHHGEVGTGEEAREIQNAEPGQFHASPLPLVCGLERRAAHTHHGVAASPRAAFSGQRVAVPQLGGELPRTAPRARLRAAWDSFFTSARGYSSRVYHNRSDHWITLLFPLPLKHSPLRRYSEYRYGCPSRTARL